MGGGAAGEASRKDDIGPLRRDWSGAQMASLLHAGSLGVWIHAWHVATLARTAAEQGKNQSED